MMPSDRSDAAASTATATSVPVPISNDLRAGVALEHVGALGNAVT